MKRLQNQTSFGSHHFLWDVSCCLLVVLLYYRQKKIFVVFLKKGVSQQIVNTTHGHNQCIRNFYIENLSCAWESRHSNPAFKNTTARRATYSMRECSVPNGSTFSLENSRQCVSAVFIWLRDHVNALTCAIGCNFHQSGQSVDNFLRGIHEQIFNSSDVELGGPGAWLRINGRWKWLYRATTIRIWCLFFCMCTCMIFYNWSTWSTSSEHFLSADAMIRDQWPQKLERDQNWPPEEHCRKIATIGLRNKSQIYASEDNCIRSFVFVYHLR